MNVKHSVVILRPALPTWNSVLCYGFWQIYLLLNDGTNAVEVIFQPAKNKILEKHWKCVFQIYLAWFEHWLDLIHLQKTSISEVVILIDLEMKMSLEAPHSKWWCESGAVFLANIVSP